MEYISQFNIATFKPATRDLLATWEQQEHIIIILQVDMTSVLM